VSRKVLDMTVREIETELAELERRWQEFREGCEGEGGGGSPGEWMIERMGELETEKQRRHDDARSSGG
jgi:hypothetical protein